ncbi:MAG: hypothetical protein AAF674_11015 [Pseudomonadota bacterium]
MAGDLQFLLSLHKMAAPFGSGLKPELAKMLAERAQQADRAAEGAVPLGAPLASVGPAHQAATDAQLSAAGIPRIGLGAKPSETNPETAPTRPTSPGATAIKR